MTQAYDLIEELLESYEQHIGADYQKYRHHVNRVFLHCVLFDSNLQNQEKYAIAAVFHDLGIWTDHTIDYLDPSIALVRKYLEETNRNNWTDEICQMIYWHHKVKKYTGEYYLTIETFRKADWIDVSLGLIKFGMDKNEINRYKTEYPYLGFHRFLVNKLLINFFRHPLKPLPMFKL